MAKKAPSSKKASPKTAPSKKGAAGARCGFVEKGGGAEVESGLFGRQGEGVGADLGEAQQSFRWKCGTEGRRQELGKAPSTSPTAKTLPKTVSKDAPKTASKAAPKGAETKSIGRTSQPTAASGRVESRMTSATGKADSSTSEATGALVKAPLTQTPAGVAASSKTSAKGTAGKASGKAAKVPAKPAMDEEDSFGAAVALEAERELAQAQAEIEAEPAAEAAAEETDKAAEKKSKRTNEIKIDRTGNLEQQWRLIHERSKAIKPVNYKMSENYEARTALLHKVLGWGYVLTSQNNRLEVLFKDGIKILIANYKSA